MVTSNSIIGRTPSVKSSTTFYQPKDIKGTQESELKRVIEEKFAVKLETYRDLHKWSCENNADFWETMLIFSDIKLGSKYLEVVEPNKHIADFPQWFRGATLNYTENCLRGRDEDVAFMSANTKCQLVSYTYLTLRNDVSILATALRQFGIVQGDVICGFLPNSYQTAVAMFATAAIGATWSSASVDFGPSGVLDRFKQVDPKVLFTVEAVTYKGKRFDLKEKLDRIVSGLPSIRRVVQFNNLNSSVDFSAYLHGDKYESLDSFVSSVKNIPSPFVFEQVPFSHPLFIMFSSGTTGIPKAMVHTVGGTLLKHVEEHLIQGNSRSCDRIMFYTTCGWMMWNWLMSFIYCGGSIVLFDESPLEPDPHIVLKVAAESKSTIIGMGAKLYDEYLRMNVDFKSLYDLRNIRLVYSTGSPLKSAAFEFINGSIAPEAVIGSISGGTDIIGCFMGCSLSLPVHPGECQCLYLGMDVKALDRNGQPVEDRQGELVCLKPFPSMPSHFLGDTNHARYKKAYFERFEGVWAHGDFCQISSKTGGVIMLGRSDATLNRGGVRIGTAEIYSVVETFPEIDDCIVAGQLVPDFDDEHILLFVKMADLFTLTDDLKRRICLQIRTMMSPRHVPNAIYAVKDIPYTNSGKKVELAVKQIINGEQVLSLALSTGYSEATRRHLMATSSSSLPPTVGNFSLHATALPFIAATLRTTSSNISSLLQKSIPTLSATVTANLSSRQCFFCENHSTTTTTTAFAVVIAVIISAGILGNLFVVGVIVSDRKMLASPVNQLLLQLAIADLGNLIFCSPDAAMALLDQGWLLPNLACPIIRFLQEYSLYASVLFQMTIGIERFMAICTPMRMQRFSSKTTVIVTSGIWTIAAAFAFPYFLHMGIVHHFCYWMNIGNNAKLLFKYAEFLVLYAVPLVMLTVVYAIMGRVLWGTSQTIANEQQQMAILKLRRSVVKMLIISMLLYFLCYTPIQGLFVMEAFFHVHITLPKWLRLLFNALSVMSSSLNPIVYIMCCRHFHSRFMAIMHRTTSWMICCSHSSYSFINGSTERAVDYSRSPYVSFKRNGSKQTQEQSVTIL